MFFHFGLIKVAEPIDHVPPHHMVVSFDMTLMGANTKLSKRDPKNMHLVPKRVWRLNNKAIPQLHVVCSA
jgi:hypothetical protein